MHVSDDITASDLAGTSVQYTLQIAAGGHTTTVSGSASFDDLTGKTAHYRASLPGLNGVYTVTSATLSLDGETVSLHNAGESFTVRGCEPSHGSAAEGEMSSASTWRGWLDAVVQRLEALGRS